MSNTKKTGSASPPAGSPAATGSADHAVPGQLVAAEAPDDHVDDVGSAYKSDNGSTTASLSSSILEYDSTYFTPNDDRQSENVDITHHYMTLLLGGKLYLAPINKEVQKVVDIGTGNSSDFADEHPGAKVIGTDLSPIQPLWIPPNLKFEIDDATKSWTWPDNTFDFVHIRFLAGGIRDWTALFKEAYRVLKPGGWLQSGEFDPRFLSDDGTMDDQEAAKRWNEVFTEGGNKIGSPFNVITDNLQEKAIKEAGFGAVEAATYKAPVGPWTADKKLAEAGQYGYTLFFCTQILGWSKEEHQVFLTTVRKMIRNYRKIHLYFQARYVWGQKPEA
ncbi:S-adenosyl-L-methionine-dependent methyltransferase [Podospora aff. communis PSN243]|uniref:S-adenosyl-L-methionine-dependent methyltransferase n=1 Tax=Podospora aff. communis PSN243 TaxID=3040156 RepID=A0AAV9GD30_9PEZI|nr:S-adenosyl-L-methionine-dependent methyltransferase [Podospora aff. communis PSN243]